LNDCTDVYVLNFNDENNNEKLLETKEEVINSKYINIKLNSKELGNSIIVFINSENKNDFIEMINKYNKIISIKTIEKYREELKNTNNKKHS
jgi:hypothetical protein